MAQPAQQQDALRALNAAASFFHRELKGRLQMRRIPFLAFRLDTSIEEGASVLAHIEEVTHSPPQGASGPSAD
jgi:ribosome-binding factor A